MGPPELLPASAGKLPVYPAKLPVPPVMVADALPEAPVRMATGSVYFPASVPPLSVIVKSDVTVVLVILVREIVLANVPFPEYTPGIVAWPVITKPVPPRVAVPVRVNVLLTVAACAPAQASSAKDKVKNVRFISLLESSTLVTQKNGGTWLMHHHAGPRPAS